MQIARKILLPQSQGKVATFNQQWTSNIYICVCLYIYIYVCIECVPIKIKYLYSSLCAPRTLSQVIFFYSSWHAPSSLSPGSGQLDLLDFLCSANQSVAQFTLRVLQNGYWVVGLASQAPLVLRKRPPGPGPCNPMYFMGPAKMKKC